MGAFYKGNCVGHPPTNSGDWPVAKSNSLSRSLQTIMPPSHPNTFITSLLKKIWMKPSGSYPLIVSKVPPTPTQLVSWSGPSEAPQQILSCAACWAWISSSVSKRFRRCQPPGHASVRRAQECQGHDTLGIWLPNTVQIFFENMINYK